MTTDDTLERGREAFEDLSQRLPPACQLSAGRTFWFKRNRFLGS